LEQLIAKTRAAIEKAREAKAKEASRYSDDYFSVIEIGGNGSVYGSSLF
jgi:hypothetical protein